MSGPCQYIFRYDGDEKSDELVNDPKGKLPIPQKDQFIPRRGRLWRVMMILDETAPGPTGPIPVRRIFLATPPRG